MTDDREKYLIGTLDVNDGENFDMESFVFTPAQKKPTLVSSNDSDGDALARESHYTSAYVEMEIRVAHQVDTPAALAKLGEITDAVQGCEREEGGRLCPWTPNGTETTYKSYAITGDITDLPIAVVGDDAGWFINCPKVKVKLTLRPFLEGEERVVLEPTESAAAPLQEVFVGDIGGDVPALGRLIVTDEAGQDRRYAALGQDVVYDEAPPGLLLTADDLTTDGFSGEAKTRSGAYGSEKVKRATAVSSSTTIAGTGRIEQVGSFAVHLRAYAGSTDTRFRISYRNGDGPLIPLRWMRPPVVGAFSEIYMGEVFFDAVELGDQSSEIRIEHRSAGASHANDANYLLLEPTAASIKVRGRASNAPTKLLGFDNFEQSEGSLSGKNLNLGGSWSGAGDSDDFTVIAASDVARRTAISDANIYTGRYAIAGSTNYTSVQVSTTMVAERQRPKELVMGVFARYLDTNNWAMAWVARDLVEGPGGGGERLHMLKRVAGTVSTLAVGPKGQDVRRGARISLQIAANGSWVARAGADVLEGHDPDLAAGGTLASGKVGIYDAWLDKDANTRDFSAFEVLGADAPGVVCHADRSIEFNSHGVLREDSGAQYWGQPDLPRGSNFFLAPAGDSERINRLAIRLRRNDIEVEADTHVTDKHTAEVRATERYLAPR